MIDEFNDEDFDMEEFEKISKLAEHNVRKKILDHINANKDDRNKIVGDMVMVWDCSRLTDVETNKYVIDPVIHSILNSNKSIVIEINCNHIAEVKTFAGDYSKILDIKIWNKSLNKIFRTSSDFVKLCD